MKKSCSRTSVIHLCGTDPWKETLSTEEKGIPLSISSPPSMISSQNAAPSPPPPPPHSSSQDWRTTEMWSLPPDQFHVLCENVGLLTFLLTLPFCSAAANCLKAVQWVALCTVAARWVYVPIWRGENCLWFLIPSFSFSWCVDETEPWSKTNSLSLLSLSATSTGGLSERLC